MSDGSVGEDAKTSSSGVGVWCGGEGGEVAAEEGWLL